MFCKKCVLRNFTKFTGKRLCQSLFFNEVAGLRPATLLKKEALAQVFSYEFCEISRNIFLQRTPLVAASGRSSLVLDSCWLVLIRVDSCWTCVDSCWFASDSCWLVLIRVGLVLIRVDLCWFVLIRVDPCWYSCIRIDLIDFLTTLCILSKYDWITFSQLVTS